MYQICQKEDLITIIAVTSNTEAYKNNEKNLHSWQNLLIYKGFRDFFNQNLSYRPF